MKDRVFQHPASPEAELRDGDQLPKASIRIDGKFDDWKGIVPAFISGAGSPAEENLAIDKVFLAVDTKNLYVKFDIKDDTPSSFLHPNNFNTKHRTNYAIGFTNSTREVEAHIALTQNQWKIEIFKKVNGGNFAFVPAFNSYSMKGPSFEASFPLEQLRQALDDYTYLAGCKVRAYISYPDDQGQNWTSCDWTGSKQFLF